MAVQRFEVTADDLAREVGVLRAEDIDALPFGAILLDGDGIVLAYNAAEERISGRRRADVIGKNWFRDIAPCTRVKRFFGAFQEGVRRGAMNEVFDFTFAFASGPRYVRIRMAYASAPKPGIWIFVTPLPG